MLYIYRTQASTGARDLAEAVTRNCRSLTDLHQAHYQTGVRAGDSVVCWGATFAGVAGVKSLNNKPFSTKFTDAQRLKTAGVATVEVSQLQPQAVAMEDPAIPIFESALLQAAEFRNTRLARSRPFRDGVTLFQRTLNDLLTATNQPAPVAQPQGEWVGRRFNHVGGNDLLRPAADPEYFVKKENIVEEYRVHSFLGKSIRAGVKKHREGFAHPNPWIRSYDGGWRIVYDGFKSKESMRGLAAKAVEALGLDFGAVDIGKKADGTLIVLEVNRAPGLEGGTTEAYAKAIEGWLTA